MSNLGCLHQCRGRYILQCIAKALIYLHAHSIAHLVRSAPSLLLHRLLEQRVYFPP